MMSHARQALGADDDHHHDDEDDDEDDDDDDDEEHNDEDTGDCKAGGGLVLSGFDMMRGDVGGSTVTLCDHDCERLSCGSCMKLTGGRRQAARGRDGALLHMLSDLRRPAQVYTDLRQPEQVYTDLRRPAQVYTDLRRPAQVYTDLRQPEQVYTDLTRPEQVYTDLRQPEQVYTDLTRPEQVYTDLRQPEQVHTDLRRPAQVYTDLRQPEQVYTDLTRPEQVYTDLRQPAQVYTDLRQPAQIYTPHSYNQQGSNLQGSNHEENIPQQEKGRERRRVSYQTEIDVDIKCHGRRSRMDERRETGRSGDGSEASSSTGVVSSTSEWEGKMMGELLDICRRRVEGERPESEDMEDDVSLDSIRRKLTDIKARRQKQQNRREMGEESGEVLDNTDGTETGSHSTEVHEVSEGGSSQVRNTSAIEIRQPLSPTQCPSNTGLLLVKQNQNNPLEQRPKIKLGKRFRTYSMKRKKFEDETEMREKSLHTLQEKIDSLMEKVDSNKLQQKQKLIAKNKLLKQRQRMRYLSDNRRWSEVCRFVGEVGVRLSEVTKQCQTWHSLAESISKLDESNTGVMQLHRHVGELEAEVKHLREKVALLQEEKSRAELDYAVAFEDGEAKAKAMHDLEVQLQTSTQENTEMVNKIEDYKTRMSMMEEQKQEQHLQLQELETECANLRIDERQKESILEIIRETIERSAGLCGTDKNNRGDVTGMVEVIMNSFVSQRSRIYELEQTLDRKIKQLTEENAKILAQQRDVEMYKEYATSKEREIENLQSVNNQIKHDFQQLQQQVSLAKADNSKLRDEVAKKNDEVNEMEKLLQEQEKSSSQYNMKNNQQDFDTRIKNRELEIEIERLQENASKNDKELERATREIQNLKESSVKDRESWEIERSELMAEVGDTLRQLDLQSFELKTLQNTIDNLKGLGKEQKDREADLIKKYETSRMEVDVYKEQVMNLEAQMDSKEKMLEEARTNMRTIEEERQEERKKLEDLLQDMNRKNKSLSKNYKVLQIQKNNAEKERTYLEGENERVRKYLEKVMVERDKLYNKVLVSKSKMMIRQRNGPEESEGDYKIGFSIAEGKGNNTRYNKMSNHKTEEMSASKRHIQLDPETSESQSDQTLSYETSELQTLSAIND